jgi:RimJ/RimL family protein N-acetyltransferase
MNNRLFQGKLIRLTPPDAERDAEIESQWTHNAEFVRSMYGEPMHPLSPNAIKKKYDEASQAAHALPKAFHFAIRTQADDRLVGFARFIRIDWSNSGARLYLAIPDEKERGKGYGTEAMQLALHFAFREMNLYRVTAHVLECNECGLGFLHKHGFVDEVRRRQVIHRDGKFWDVVMLGLLRDEWSAK